MVSSLSLWGTGKSTYSLSRRMSPLVSYVASKLKDGKGNEGHQCCPNFTRTHVCCAMVSSYAFFMPTLPAITLFYHTAVDDTRLFRLLLIG